MPPTNHKLYIIINNIISIIIIFITIISWTFEVERCIRTYPTKPCSQRNHPSQSGGRIFSMNHCLFHRLLVLWSRSPRPATGIGHQVQTFRILNKTVVSATRYLQKIWYMRGFGFSRNNVWDPVRYKSKHYRIFDSLTCCGRKISKCDFGPSVFLRKLFQFISERLRWLLINCWSEGEGAALKA